MENSGEHEVVAASKAHIEGILDVLTSVASEERWIGTELPFDRNARHLGIQATIERADALVLVALTNGVVVGELTLRPRWPGLLELGMAIVAPWRSQGVGTSLLSRGIDWARHSGAHKISLEVFPHNAPAIGLYARHGFVQEGLFRRHMRRRSGELWDSIPMAMIIE